MDRGAAPTGNGIYKLERRRPDHALRPLAAAHEPRRAAAADQRAPRATCRSLARVRASRTRPSTSSRTTSSASSSRPGITGLWQVTARAQSTFGEALDMDVAYARGWSLGLDLWLLLRTPWAQVACRRARPTGDERPSRSPSSASATGARTSSRNLIELEDAELAGVCDQRPGALETHARPLPGRSRDDASYEDVLADPRSTRS